MTFVEPLKHSEGKDVIAMLLQSFFGDVDDHGYCVNVDSEFFCRDPIGGVRDKERSQPMLHSLTYSRVCLVPEVPNKQLDMHKLKPLCEQVGVKAASRTHCSSVVRRNPTWMFWFFSNFNAEVGESPDSGTVRRVNVMSLRNRYGGDVDGEHDRSDIKVLAKNGVFALEMFHTVKVFYGILSQYSTNIRRPARVQRETDEVTNNTTEKAAFHEWVLSKFEPAIPGECATETQVKNAVANHLECSVRQVKTKMIEKGFTMDCNDGKGHRFVMYKFDSNGAASAVKFKSSSSSSSV